MLQDFYQSSAQAGKGGTTAPSRVNLLQEIILHGLNDEQAVDIRFAASQGADIQVCFEPIGTTFTLTPLQAIYLRMPLAAVAELEVVGWSNGVGVWGPYPGTYVVLNGDRTEIDRL